MDIQMEETANNNCNYSGRLPSNYQIYNRIRELQSGLDCSSTATVIPRPRSVISLSAESSVLTTAMDTNLAREQLKSQRSHEKKNWVVINSDDSMTKTKVKIIERNGCVEETEGRMTKGFGGRKNGKGCGGGGILEWQGSLNTGQVLTDGKTDKKKYRCYVKPLAATLSAASHLNQYDQSDACATADGYQVQPILVDNCCPHYLYQHQLMLSTSDDTETGCNNKRSFFKSCPNFQCNKTVTMERFQKQPKFDTGEFRLSHNVLSKEARLVQPTIGCRRDDQRGHTHRPTIYGVHPYKAEEEEDAGFGKPNLSEATNDVSTVATSVAAALKVAVDRMTSRLSSSSSAALMTSSSSSTATFCMCRPLMTSSITRIHKSSESRPSTSFAVCQTLEGSELVSPPPPPPPPTTLPLQGRPTMIGGPIAKECPHNRQPGGSHNGEKNGVKMRPVFFTAAARLGLFTATFVVLFSVLLYFFLRRQLEYDVIVSTVTSSVTGVLIAVTLRSSMRARCCTALVLPSIGASTRTRNGYLLLMTVLLITGPLANVRVNVRETARSLACNVELNHNQSRLLTDPYGALLDRLNLTAERLQEAVGKVGVDVKPLSDGLDQLNDGLQNGFLQLFGAHKTCRSFVDKAYGACLSSLAKARDQCSGVMTALGNVYTHARGVLDSFNPDRWVPHPPPDHSRPTRILSRVVNDPVATGSSSNKRHGVAHSFADNGNPSTAVVQSWDELLADERDICEPLQSLVVCQRLNASEALCAPGSWAGDVMRDVVNSTQAALDELVRSLHMTLRYTAVYRVVDGDIIDVDVIKGADDAAWKNTAVSNEEESKSETRQSETMQSDLPKSNTHQSAARKSRERQSELLSSSNAIDVYHSILDDVDGVVNWWMWLSACIVRVLPAIAAALIVRSVWEYLSSYLTCDAFDNSRMQSSRVASSNSPWSNPCISTAETDYLQQDRTFSNNSYLVDSYNTYGSFKNKCPSCPDQSADQLKWERSLSPNGIYSHRCHDKVMFQRATNTPIDNAPSLPRYNATAASDADVLNADPTEQDLSDNDDVLVSYRRPQPALPTIDEDQRPANSTAKIVSRPHEVYIPKSLNADISDWSKDDINNESSGSFIILFHAVFATLSFAADYALYGTLSIVSRSVRPPVVSLDFTGAGGLAGVASGEGIIVDLLDEFLRTFHAGHWFGYGRKESDVDEGESQGVQVEGTEGQGGGICLCRPSVPGALNAATAAFMYALLVTLSVCCRRRMLRLRRSVCSYFYPGREHCRLEYRRKARDERYRRAIGRLRRLIFDSDEQHTGAPSDLQLFADMLNVNSSTDCPKSTGCDITRTLFRRLPHCVICDCPSTGRNTANSSGGRSCKLRNFRMDDGNNVITAQLLCCEDCLTIFRYDEKQNNINLGNRFATPNFPLATPMRKYGQVPGEILCTCGTSDGCPLESEHVGCQEQNWYQGPEAITTCTCDQL